MADHTLPRLYLAHGYNYFFMNRGNWNGQNHLYVKTARLYFDVMTDVDVTDGIRTCECIL